ncbi:amidohydrolase family protein [Fusibacter sp. JL216-2]|uniref:amidohydrolase family protein n=1 Tax=Fusibacter sp. JL216-2 TaxID=3071453 RepID=UPI003D35430F
MNEIKILRGHIIFTDEMDDFTVHEKSYLVSIDGIIEDVYETLPSKYGDIDVIDYGDSLIIPGFYDMHNHAGQYLQCGTGMTKQLLEWLKDYTYKLEADLDDEAYAKEVYKHFVEDLLKYGTLGTCTFATSSTRGTACLYEAFKASGLRAYVGKVNMVANAPDYITEDLQASIKGNLELIDKYGGEEKVKPIITPRFAPTSTEASMQALGEIAKVHGLPVQSHISENPDEIKWVKALYPWSENYASVYNKFGLYGQVPTLMAHAVHLTLEEVDMSKNKNMTLVHCPDSNINVRSGIAPVKMYLKEGVQVALGSDIAGGHKIQMNEAIVRAVQSSKHLSLTHPGAQLSLSEAFYMATAQGGAFFGKMGKLKKSYALDALVINDHRLYKQRYSLLDRLEKFIYIGDDRWITDRYVGGLKL